MIESIAMQALGEFFKFTKGKWEDSEKVRVLRIVASEALLREMKLNLDLFEEMASVKSGEISLRVRNALVEGMSTSQFEELTKSGFPLKKLLDSPLMDGCWDSLDARDKKCVADLKVVADLIERTYHRLKIFKIRTSVGSDRTRRKYLKYLMLATIRNLEVVPE